MMKVATQIKNMPQSTKVALAAAVIVTVAVVIGGLIMFTTRAGGFFAALEPEQGTLAGGAKVVDDGAASSGKTLQFAAATPQPEPEPGAKPSTSNTGILPGVTLKQHSGNLVIKTDGVTISETNVMGNLYIVANNVTLKNVKVNGSTYINLDDQGNLYAPVRKNITLTNVDLVDIATEGLDGLVIDKARVRGQPEGASFQVKSSRDSRGFLPCRNLTLTNSLFEAPGPVRRDSTHRENFHPMGCVNLVVKNNVFDMRHEPGDQFTLARTTAAVFFQTWEGQINENVTYDGNYHYGGGYFQIYLHLKNGTVTNNKFYTYPGGSIVFPPKDNPEPYYPFQQSGNMIDDKPVMLLNSK